MRIGVKSAPIPDQISPLQDSRHKIRNGYLLVIYKMTLCFSHLLPPPPPPPPPPSPGKGWGIPVEMSSVFFCIVPALREKYQGFVLNRQKRQCNKNIKNCTEKWRLFYQLVVPAVWAFLAGFCWTEQVKVPAIPRGWGTGFEMPIFPGVYPLIG